MTDTRTDIHRESPADIAMPRTNIFTVVSIGFGLLLLGIILSLLAQSRLVNVVNSSAQQAAVTAVDLAKDRVELVKSLPAPGRDTLTHIEPYGEITQYPQFKRTTVLHTAENSPAVTVTVFWNQDRHSIRLEALLPRR